jgi:hypothetical protein
MARVLAHAHSTWSHDGTLTLNDWGELTPRLGCDVVLLTEHEETGWTAARYEEYVAACRSASRKGVKLIPGIEFSQDGFHVLCYGLQFFPHRPSSIDQLAAAVDAQGCFLCLAHPGKYRWEYSDLLLSHVQAVEVWNSKWIYDGMFGPHPNSVKLSHGKLLLVGQDVHKVKHLSSLHIETHSDDIVADLLARHYWISLGKRRLSPEELRYRFVTGLVQRCRTQTLQTALRLYQSMRKHRAPSFSART